MKEFHTERLKNQFYIDPAGKIHRCKMSADEIEDCASLHYEIAKTFFPDLEYPEDHLFNLN